MIVDDEIDCGGDGWEEDDLVLGNLDDDNNDNSAHTTNNDDDLVPRLQPPPTPSLLPPSSFDRTIRSNKADDYNDNDGGDFIGGGGWDDDLNFTLDDNNDDVLDDNDDDINNNENNGNVNVKIAAAVAAVNNPTPPPGGDGDYSGGGTGRWPFNDTSLMNALDVTTATTIIDNDTSYEVKHEKDEGASMNVMEETVVNNDDNWDFDDDELDITFNNNENDTKNENIIHIKSEVPETMATIIDRIPHPQPLQQHYNVPPHQSMAHNNNDHIADDYGEEDNIRNKNLSPRIISNYEVGEGGWDFDGEDDTDIFNDKNNDNTIEMEETVSAVVHPPTLTQHLSRPNFPPPPPPPPPPAALSHIAHRTRSANNSNTQPPLPINSNNNTNNPVEERIYKMLSSYMESLHDSKLYTRLHTKLNNLLHSSDSSGGGVSTASELCTYYATRPGLRKYTLGVELDRMDYELIVPVTNNNKGCVSITSKEKIRQYFNVDIHGERLDHTFIDDDVGVVSTVELLIRSANQSLLADMLVALTCPEEMMDGEDDERNIKMRSSNNGLILSGPTLCMTSVAEKCCFKIELLSGFVETICLLAISIPCNHHNADVDVIPDNADGRLILARAEVSVRFRPVGIENDNEECTVQYAVRSVIPYYAPDSDMIRCAALALAQEDQYTHSFVNNEYNSNNRQGYDGNQCVIATDARDQFLLSHQLVDSGLLVVSDHLDRLRDAAHAKTTGFRSALRQLDGVTNVSSKLHDLGRFGASLGLVLPSVEEINAAEREAMEDQHSLSPLVSSALKFSRPADMPAASGSVVHFPRLMDTGSIQTRVPPPPPPHLPMSSNKPRPLIGGLLMSGLSRLAAVATLPDESRSENDMEGATTASSTRPTTSSLFSGNNVSRAYHHAVHTTKEAYHVAAEEDKQNTALVHKGLDTNHGVVDDAGWSDDEFVFDDTGDDNERVEKTYVTDDVQLNVAKSDKGTTAIHNTSNEHHAPIPRQHPSLQSTMIPPRTTKPPPPPPPTPPSQQEQTNSNNSDKNNKACDSPRTFEDEFVMVLREKQESEIHEMKVSGMMKRWRPISEDPVLRTRLLEAMVAQIQRS